jgi:pyruvate,orthophosphate dikinase
MCGEHGGDPTSILFFQKEGVNCISCSPYRIPTAKVAAAQAHIEEIARK